MMARSARPGRVVRITAPVLVLLALAVLPLAADAQEPEEPTLISLDADSTSLTDILEILAVRTDLNIVTGSEVQGRYISIHLRNTPFEEALNLVVRAAGLGYERVGNSILVADVRRLATETGLGTRVFELQYASAPDLREVLKVLPGEVTANARGDRLLMRATQSILEQAEGIIAQLDRKPPQVLLEARLIEVNTTRLKELGIDWEKITKWTGVVTEGEVGGSVGGDLGQQIGFIKFDETADFYRQREVFELALDALITDGSATILSSSNVVTLSGEPAEIFAGETVPVVITSLQNPGVAGGVLQSVQLEKIDVGVRLDIVPRVAPDGYITTLVQPEISRIIAFVGPDDDLPQTSTRRARALVRVRDGEKIYLGGLLSEEKRQTVKRVPLLGSIPVLGYLFQHTRTETARLDLVIEITPRVIGDDGFVVPHPTLRPRAADPEATDPETAEGADR